MDQLPSLYKGTKKMFEETGLKPSKNALSLMQAQTGLYIQSLVRDMKDQRGSLKTPYSYRDVRYAAISDPVTRSFTPSEDPEQPFRDFRDFFAQILKESSRDPEIEEKAVVVAHEAIAYYIRQIAVEAAKYTREEGRKIIKRKDVEAALVALMKIRERRSAGASPAKVKKTVNAKTRKSAPAGERDKYDAMTVVQLKELLRERKVPGRSNKRKAELLEMARNSSSRGSPKGSKAGSPKGSKADSGETPEKSLKLDVSEDLEKLTVVKLKELLRAKKLPVSGRKAELINRLKEVMEEPKPKAGRVEKAKVEKPEKAKKPEKVEKAKVEKPEKVEPPKQTALKTPMTLIWTDESKEPFIRRPFFFTVQPKDLREAIFRTKNLTRLIVYHDCTSTEHFHIFKKALEEPHARTLERLMFLGKISPHFLYLLAPELKDFTPKLKYLEGYPHYPVWITKIRNKWETYTDPWRQEKKRPGVDMHYMNFLPQEVRPGDHAGKRAQKEKTIKAYEAYVQKIRKYEYSLIKPIADLWPDLPDLQMITMEPFSEKVRYTLLN